MMFNAQKLSKLKNDFYEALKVNFKSISPNNYSQKERSVFEKYDNLKSLAGMETWLSNYYEREFILESLTRLHSIHRNEETKLKIFHEDLNFSIKNNFREEDYRFQQLEEACQNKKILTKHLLSLKKESDKKLGKIEFFYLLSKNFKYFYKTTGLPSILGTETKLQKKITPIKKVHQLNEAERELHLNWKEGFEIYKALTDSIVIVSSPGLVSYSHFNELGISYINVIDRDLFDTVDDLVHENSHHHLNLILKKYKLLKINSNIVFYSPWRQSLRNIYAIIHSVFTFSFGAMLFGNILKNPSPMMEQNLERVAFRFIEETIMLNYSLTDLVKYQNELTLKGKQIIFFLEMHNQQNLKKIKSVGAIIKSKSFKKKLSEQEKSLKIARKTYG